MKLQKLLSLVRQAVERYGMIETGDRIAVGVSGGKDSLTLLMALKKLSEFYPEPFEVCGILVDLGYENTDSEEVRRFCEALPVEFSVIHTQIGQIVLEERKEKEEELEELMETHAFTDVLFLYNLNTFLEDNVLHFVLQETDATEG